MYKKLLLLAIFVFSFPFIYAQTVTAPSEYIKAITSQWDGERFSDGRPKVPDEYLDHLKNATIEQIWGYLGRHGYTNQVAMNWTVLKPGETMVGRVVTTQFMPSRPDLDSIVDVIGKKEGHSQQGSNNIWPIDMLTKGDIYVADGYGKVKDGTLIGSSLGNAIYGRSGKGVIFDGSVRDMQELRDTDGFNAWIKGHHPSFIKSMTPISINAPIRIGSATVFPGDVAFANDYGVAFIPSHMVKGLVMVSELTGLRDEFERVLLQRAEHPAGEIHGEWSDEIKDEFREWVSKYPRELFVTEEQIESYLSHD